MKKWMFISIVLFFLSSSFSNHPSDTNRFNDWEDDWLVETSQAEAMINYLNCSSPKCKKPKHFNYDNNIVRQINEKYKPSNWQWIPARYRDEDEVRYRKARKIPNGHGKGQVSGYETKLLKITIADGLGIEAENQTLYFDIGEICPPPNNCN